jgi:hypothetical protein
VEAFSPNGTGNELANRFTGSSVSDTFTGAGGNDTFNRRTVSRGIMDIITDFNADNAEHDRIDLHGRGLDSPHWPSPRSPAASCSGFSVAMPST